MTSLIVDDEPIARRRIRRMLVSEPDVDVVGECTNGQEAAELLSRRAVDLLFLDVQMPQMGGFDLLSSVSADRVGAVVFVTAYDDFAVRAFEFHALDYLLKPFDQARFHDTVDRARREMAARRNGEQTERLELLLADLRSRRPERIPIKTPNRLFFVRADEIDWVEAADNYVCLHVRGETHLLRETMGAIEARLEPLNFQRIHRSTIVNTERIKELRPWFNGEYQVVLQNGAELILSRSYRDKVLTRLGR